MISLGEMLADTGTLLYHTSVYFVLKYCLSLPKSIPSLSFPLTNDHMCPPLPLFHGVIANTLANGRKKWGLHANFGGIVSPGYIHTKHNAVIIRVQTPASSLPVSGACADRLGGIQECGDWMRCYDGVQSYFYPMSLRLAIIPCRQGISEPS